MTGALLDYALMVGVGGLGSILIWLLLGPRVSGRGLEGFISRAGAPGRSQDMLFALFDIMLLWATTHQISTGKKCKVRQETDDVDDAGNPVYEDVEVEESLTPLDMLINRMSRTMLARFKSAEGGIKSQLGAALVGKKKNQTTLDYALEQLIARAGPRIGEVVDAKVNDALQKINTSGGYDYPK